VHAVALLLPHVLIAAAWWTYISVDPEAFAVQFTTNLGHRFDLVQSPWQAVVLEWQRYFGGPDASRAGLLRLSLALPYLFGLAVAAVSRPFRQSFGVKVLVLMAVALAATLVLLDSRKIYVYTVHVTPYAVALSALAIAHLFIAGPLPRRVAIGGGVLIVAVQLSGTVYAIVRDGYRRDFLPAALELQSEVRAGRRIVGSAEFAFVLGFDAPLSDDTSLGYFSRQPFDVLVVDPLFEQRVEWRGRRSPAIAAHIDATRAALGHRTRLGAYTIYRRAAPGGLSSGTLE
jgi:hypothetical protein